MSSWVAPEIFIENCQERKSKKTALCRRNNFPKIEAASFRASNFHLSDRDRNPILSSTEHQNFISTALKKIKMRPQAVLLLLQVILGDSRPLWTRKLRVGRLLSRFPIWAGEESSALCCLREFAEIQRRNFFKKLEEWGSQTWRMKSRKFRRNYGRTQFNLLGITTSERRHMYMYVGVCFSANMIMESPAFYTLTHTTVHYKNKKLHT